MRMLLYIVLCAQPVILLEGPDQSVVKGAGKVCIVHMCGKLKGFAAEVGAGRMDGIDSLCPPTTGDFWAHEARVS